RAAPRLFFRASAGRSDSCRAPAHPAPAAGMAASAAGRGRSGVEFGAIPRLTACFACRISVPRLKSPPRNVQYYDFIIVFVNVFIIVFSSTMSFIMETPANRLKKARQEAGYATATDAAHAMGMKPPTYLGHENGTTGLRRTAAIRYAKFYG